MQRLLLALLLFGIVGLIAELVLLEHYDRWEQWIPLVLLSCGLIVTVAIARSAAPAITGAFRLVMMLFVATGVLGVYFHYQGNAEFALEQNPNLSGFAFLWEVARGATPALAPGALAQLGLLGLLCVYRNDLSPRA